jgi:hypothetical protein
MKDIGEITVPQLLFTSDEAIHEVKNPGHAYTEK